jgi:hypothetical protein
MNLSHFQNVYMIQDPVDWLNALLPKAKVFPIKKK